MQSLIVIILTLFFFWGTLDARDIVTQYHVSKTILVDKHGHGNFDAVQKAIDSIPSNNAVWTRIQLNHGIYVEKVVIPRDKPYIILEGHPRLLTTIEYGDSGDVIECPTFKLLADNFVARNIVFKNTYDRVHSDMNKITWAPAAAIAGDKASFYKCSFISYQDTLNDAMGRHYFYGCYIDGAIDFIWGNGQSIYEACHINAIGYGYITAQGRENEKESSGFVFKNCHVSGSNNIPTYLGRAYRKYSRVLFVGTYIDKVITPKGWEAAWGTGHEDLITFSEVNCRGPGADMSQRVKWEKKLSYQELTQLTSTKYFINQDGWMQKQPSN